MFVYLHTSLEEMSMNWLLLNGLLVKIKVKLVQMIKSRKTFTFSGYFAHVTTMAEVKEQVLKYIPVMARPLVLYRKDHPVKWTGVYADIEVPNQRSLWVIGIKKPLPRRRLRVSYGPNNYKMYYIFTNF